MSRRLSRLAGASARPFRRLFAWLRSRRVWDWLLTPKPRPAFRRVRLGCEALEAREVPAVLFDPLYDQSVTEGQYVAFQVAATDTEGSPISYSASAVPDGLYFDHAAGTFVGGLTFRAHDLAGGTLTTTVTATSADGEAAEATFNWAISDSPQSSSTTLFSSSNPASFGDPLTLSATVYGLQGTPAGTVSFYDGSEHLGDAPLDGNGAATLQIGPRTPGSHSLSAVYSGDQVYGGSSASLDQSVGAAGTATALTYLPSAPVEFGGVTLTASVTSTAGFTPTGSVMFYDGGVQVGAALVDGDGRAALSFMPSPGPHTITANYAGDGTSAGSAATVGFDVRPYVAPTGVWLTSPPPSVGDPVTLGAVVSSNYGVPTGTVAFYVDSAFAGSGTIDASGYASVTPGTLPGGDHQVVGVFDGSPGFAGSSSTGTLTVARAASSLVLSFSGSSVYGTPTTFTAAVTSPVGAPTGPVDFYAGDTLIGSAAVDGGYATLTTSDLPAGYFLVRAVYAGDTDHAGTSSDNTDSTVWYSVARANTTTAVSASPPSPAYGDDVVFTAAVTYSGGTPTGTVTFVVGGGTLATVPLQSDGTAAYDAGSLRAGSYSISAIYSGDENHNGSAGDWSQGLGLATSTTSIAPSSDPAGFGDVVDFAIGVAGAGDAPAGAVDLYRDGSFLATVTLQGGSATFQASGWPVGSYSLTAVYGGDTFHQSSSGSTSLTVAPGATALQLSSNVNPSNPGDSITVTATVSAASLEGLGGDVQFYLDGSYAGAVPVSGGQASLSLGTPPRGDHTIVAMFSGDASHAGSSGSMTQSVQGLQWDLGVWANPSTYGEPAQISVSNVTSIYGPPTGSIQFSVDGADAGTVAVRGMYETVNVSGLPAGPHTVVATYSGDQTYSGSSSSASFEVAPAATALTVSSSDPAAPNGASLSFTANVSGPGSTPTGSVEFFANSGSNQWSLGTANLTDGQAVLTGVTLGIGSYTVSAVYMGDSNHTGSGNSITQTVDRQATTMGLASANASDTYGPPVNLVATVAAASGTPTGMVNFFYYGSPVGSAPLQADGTATQNVGALGAGSYAYSAVYVGDADYQGNSADYTVSVGRAPLVIRADDAQMVAGDPMPLLTAASEGLVNGDTLDGFGLSFSTEATSESPPGAYPVSVSAATPDANYAVTYQHGTLFVVEPSIWPPEDNYTTVNTPLVFSEDEGNPVWIDDYVPATALLTLTLTATSGTVTLATTANLTFAAGTGTDDQTLTATGTLADLTNALDGLTFTPDADFVGDASIAVQLDDPATLAAGRGTATGTIDIAVDWPAPELTVPGDMTVTAGQTVPLAATVQSDYAITSVEWWFSYDGEDWEQDPDMTTLSASHLFGNYGDVDVWVVVTDEHGMTAEDGFHVTVNEFVPVDDDNRVTATGDLTEGSWVTFTVKEVNPDDSDTTSVFADWYGDENFDEVQQEQWTVNDDGSISFSHYYDDNPQGGNVFNSVIRIENEGGESSSYTVPVEINNVAPTALLGTGNLQRGYPIASKATGGADVWSAAEGDLLQFYYVTEPSQADAAQLKYHWRVVDEATGQVIRDFDQLTDDPFVPLPDWKWGKVYQVQAYIEEKDSGPTETQEITVVMGGTGRTVQRPYHDAYTDGERIDYTQDVTYLTFPDGIYGNFLPAGDQVPEEYNRFMRNNVVSKDVAADDNFTLDLTLDAAAQSMLDENTTVVYNFDVSIYDVEQFSIGSNNFDLLYEYSFSSPVGSVTIGGLPNDRLAMVTVYADLMRDGEVVSHSPLYRIDASTPKTVPTFQLIDHLFDGLGTIVNEFGSSATQLWDAVTSAPQTFLDAMIKGLSDAVKEYFSNAGTELQTALFTWLNNGSAPSFNVDLTNPASITAFLLQYSGLTWDHVQQVLLQQLGAGNLAAIEGVAAAFGRVDPNDPTGPNGLLTVLPTAGLPNINVSDLLTQAAGNFDKIIKDTMVKTGAAMAAKFIPGFGMINSLYQGLSWVLQNAGQLTGLMATFTGSIDALKQGDADLFKQRLLTTFRTLAPAMVGMGAAQLGLGKLPQDIKDTLAIIPQKVDAALRKLVASIAKTPAISGGTSAKRYDGLMAPKRAFRYPDSGEPNYELWVVKDTKQTRIMLGETFGTKQVWELTPAKFRNVANAPALLSNLKQAADALLAASRPGQPGANNKLNDLRAKQAAVAAAEDALIVAIKADACIVLNAGCFAAGTKLWTPEGYRSVEDIKPNDLVFARDEFDPNGPVEAKLVEEKFERTGRILHLHLAGGMLIRTTPEHPFFVYDKGWTQAGALEEGDRLRTDGGWTEVEEVFDTGEYEKVYNLRVAEWHTYFVGEQGRGAPVWAHNAYIGPYGSLNAPQGTEKHHIGQHAAFDGTIGYNYYAAPAITLFGPSSRRGTPHYEATQEQRRRNAALRASGATQMTIQQQADIAEAALQAALNAANAGPLTTRLTAVDIQRAMVAFWAYVATIGANANTLINVPG